ncbi:MAG: DUF1553 domain-containing protein [Verrucomicrobiaceae bacterium]|nr:MAG: DUF1553 domain-containing protein [Verrucomicrobiaceae bacterium]
MNYFVLILVLFSAFATVLDAEVTYNFDVKPILSDRCYHCHGPDKGKRKADLRLDTQEGINEAIKSGELIARITSTDPEEKMPPPKSKLSVTGEEVSVLRDWIKGGGKVQSHWSFIPIQTSKKPNAKSNVHPIDTFIKDKLKSLDWDLLPEPSKEKLIRRVAFDLTGLPPRPEEVKEYIEDDSPAAYSQMVDRYLAKTAYGERMASHWLDVARYSDTYGYQVDRDRFVWPWRDWVISAFNENKPYSEFITEQIAGDMLPNATEQQIQATTFSRLHPQKVEGGSTEEEFRVEYVADRLHTFGTAFLGLTLECARCHDHKYDPVSQKEYYQLFSYFQNISESGLYSYFTPAVPTPTMRIMDDQKKANLKALKQKVTVAQNTLIPGVKERFQEWLKTNPKAELKGQVFHQDFEGNLGRNSSVPGKIGKAIKLTGDDAFGTKVGNFRRYQPFSISLWMKTPDVKERAVVFHRSRAWTDSGSRGYQLLIEEGKLSWSLIHFWPGNALRIKTKQQVVAGKWVHVTVSNDGSSSSSGLKIYIDGAEAECDVIRDHLYKGITGGGGDNISIGERFRDRGFKNGLVDEFKVFNRELTRVEVMSLINGGQFDSDLEYYTSAIDVESLEQKKQLEKARADLANFQEGLQEIMVMRELAEPKTAYILERGAYDKRGKEVFAGTPSFLPGDGGPNRLDLTEWLIDPENPLTSRVAVNRFWQMCFGEGLVRTPEDFGSQGQIPTHPELLDWLSNYFINSGWDIKKLLHLILTSSAYKQGSDVPRERLVKDPENRFISRMSRTRLSAEMIRDQSLAVSGLLSVKLGGPPVKPYEVTESFKPMGRDKGEGLYRRSLYTFWKRTGPAPVMMALDASKRDVCRVKRERTSTPLQALVMLNDPQINEASRIFGEKIYQKNDGQIGPTIIEMFTNLTSRRPSEKELKLMEALYNEQRDGFLKDPESAKKYLAVGDAPHDKKIPQENAAALGVLGSALFNFWESVAKY